MYDVKAPKFHLSRDPEKREGQVERMAMAAALELPRMSGDPDVIATEIGLRVIARAAGFVYVSSYVRHAVPERRHRRGGKR